jgi:hypothetical protein
VEYWSDGVLSFLRIAPRSREVGVLSGAVKLPNLGLNPGNRTCVLRQIVDEAVPTVPLKTGASCSTNRQHQGRAEFFALPVAFSRYRHI